MKLTSGISRKQDDVTVVSGMIADLDRVTQVNATLIEQADTAAGELKEQAMLLGDAASRFQVTLGCDKDQSRKAANQAVPVALDGAVWLIA